MGLLERDAYLEELELAMRDAAAGNGRVALVSGEAGIGKTTLVERFVQELSSTARVLWGVCDALFTPRPLGPLYDMALQMQRSGEWRAAALSTAGGEQAELAALLHSGANRSVIFSAVLSELQALQSRRPTIAVFEDVHWADEATLDLLRFLGRRIAHTCALLIMTYRDDELGPRHPLRTVLGDLASSAATRRISLRPLTESAVRTLIGEHGIDATVLHRQTGGNPFFVTEVLASIGGLPPTVRDAVLARAARLSPSAQAVLQAAAVVGTRVEPWVLAGITGAKAGDGGDAITEGWVTLEECLASGVLLAQGDLLAFRHELARQAILESISPPHKLVLHRLTLDALKAAPATRSNLARLAHHAEAAGDRDAVLEYAPAAAKRSSAASAHHAAATLYSLALRFADTLPPAERAQLLELFAQECNLVDLRAEGLEACQKALAIWRELGEPLEHGKILVHMANMLIGLGRNSEANQRSREAIAILEAQPPGRELAQAYRMQGTLRFLEHDYREAISWAEKDIAVSERLDNINEILSAQNVIGSAWLFLDYERGCRHLEANLTTARDIGRETTAAHAYANLGSGSCELYHLRRAEQYLAEGIAYAAERDLDRLRLYMLGWQAMTNLRLGRWDEAAEVAGAVLQRPGLSVTTRITALATSGYLLTRRGAPEAGALLDEALELSQQIGSLHRIGLVRAARAENAWQTGDRQRAAEEARAVYDLAISKQHPWFSGELAFWRWRAGEKVSLPEWAQATPFALHIGGDWRAAAAEWARLRCPFEQARALADGETPAQFSALEIFEGLGARQAADQLRQKLRAAGVTHIPRGPRPSTRENPYGLTNRQAEILGLLAEGLTNAEIAARLHLSPKTVDHHVSAVLARLDVHSREDAAALVRQSSD